MSTETVKIEALEKRVTELYSFRDFYIHNNGASKASQKEPAVQQKMQIILTDLDALRSRIPDSSSSLDLNARFDFIRAKALNVLSSPNGEVLTLLTRALKHSSTNADGWVQLGEAHWKRGELENARQCFERVYLSYFNFFIDVGIIIIITIIIEGNRDLISIIAALLEICLKLYILLGVFSYYNAKLFKYEYVLINPQNQQMFVAQQQQQ